MKKLVVVIAIFLAFQTVKAQDEKVSHYVFDDFVNGTIKFQAGADMQAKLNYNTVTEEMVFLQNGSPMAMTEANKIDTVYINGLKFVPVDKVFYEVVPVKNRSFYIKHISTITPPPTDIGMGGSTTQNSGQNAVSNIKLQNGIYSLKLPDYKILHKDEFYVKTGKNYQRINNVKSLEAIYPGKSNELKQYVKDNHINFDKKEDILKLLSSF